MSDLNLLTRTEAYTAINDPATAAEESSLRDLEVIDIWVPALSRRIDELCGPVVTRTITETHSGNGRDKLYLRTPPAVSITSVTVDGDEIASGGYDLDNDNRFLAILYRTTSTWPDGRRNIVVEYEAGRYADTATVGPLFKMAAGAILRRMWSREAGAWARGGDPFAEAGAGSVGFFKAVDPMVHEFLGDEMRPPAVA